MASKKSLVFGVLLLVISVGVFGESVSAATKLIDYGFEDWTGDADTTPEYVFYTSYWEDHETGTEVIQDCNGRTAYEGNYFWRRNYYGGEYDSCLGSTPLSENSHNNIDSGISEVNSSLITLRFWFRLSGDWPNNGTSSGTKWTRLYSGDGAGDDSSWFVNFHEEADRFMALDWGNLDWDYWQVNNLNDGQWHSYSVKHERLNSNNQNPNGEITVWVDDWNMSGTPIGSRQIYIPDENGLFNHLTILANWGGSENTPSSEMAVEIDDIEIWDGMPTSEDVTTDAVKSAVSSWKQGSVSISYLFDLIQSWKNV